MKTVMVLICIVLFCGCSKEVSTSGYRSDPNMVELSRAEVAIVRAMEAQLRIRDVRIEELSWQVEVIKEILRSDPNRAL